MKDDRYSIEVSDTLVLIHGYLSIREAFDFLSFFEQQGFNCVMPGDENSCLRLFKKKDEAQEKAEESALKSCQEQLRLAKNEITRLGLASAYQENFFKLLLSKQENGLCSEDQEQKLTSEEKETLYQLALKMKNEHTGF